MKKENKAGGAQLKGVEEGQQKDNFYVECESV